MMPTYDRVVVMQNDSKLALEGLPFQAGDRVQVLIIPLTPAVNQEQQLRGSVLQYSEPFAPVAAEEWEALK